MKKTKITALILAGCMALSLTACSASNKRDRDDDGDKRVETTTEEETTTTKETTEETTEATTEETTTEATTEASSEETSATSPAREAFKGKITNFSDMHFFINGKKYTLGKTTLQEMIDDGVPFYESDIKNASKEMKKNAKSLNGFRIQLDKFWAAQVGVMNLSSSAKPMSECVIYSVRLPSIESKYNNGCNFAFDFPIDITMEELTANAGEPKKDDKKHTDSDNGNYTDVYSYKQKSKKYIGSKYYEFEFKNGEISRISISYIP